jgi:type IV pilus assembly protein PilY1
MSHTHLLFKRTLALAVSASLAFSGPLHAALTEISNEPLAQPAVSVKPNIMLILDDSDGMKRQYAPDHLGRLGGGSNAFCFDSGDDDAGLITGTLDNCEPGDPPLMSPDINSQYYNPELRYTPALNYDGSSKTNMTSANTTAWTTVPTDNVTPAGTDSFRRTILDMNGAEGATVTSTANLAASFPDRVWCNLPSATETDTSVCRTNSSYSYPSAAFPYGKTALGVIKRVYGAPYYYRLAPEYCTDATLTACQASADATHAVPAFARYCSDSALTTCQAKYSTSYPYPKFTGIVLPPGTGSTGTAATGTITVRNPQKDTAGGSITSITVNGVSIISGTITAAASFTPSVVATNIAAAINAYASSPDYTATAAASSNVVTITYAGVPAKSTTPNGYAIAVSFGALTYTAATEAFSVNNTVQGDSITTITVTLNSVTTSLISGSVTCPTTSSCPSGNGSGPRTTRNTYMATQLAAAINANTSSGLTHGYSATSSGVNVTITAPASLGSSINTVTPASTKSAGATITLSMGAFANGITSGDIENTTTAFANGADPVPVTDAVRQNVGSFARVNIASGQTYTKYAARTDCAADTTCTYDEEMTNFANWYAYYRSRMQMAKTSIGTSFASLTDSFRVGFITVNYSSADTARYLAVNDFATGSGNQRDNWYTKLYQTTNNASARPLREALSRVGRYYGNVTTGINSGMGSTDPVVLACRPNYAILAAGGNWDGNAGQKLDGSAVGNQDNADSGYSLRSQARYDGALASSTDTLADVALYYYKNDLRSTLADQVPTTSKDTASHQHMTTYTVGIGSVGQLNYDANYESGTNQDFEKLKLAPASGGQDWPVPASGNAKNIDDLWHAGVNGRGTFYSIADPAALAGSLLEALTSVAGRVGAGAAAATSNLQPVAGDNFAFTAQYETVSWIGDLKAKTIDLSTGTVAFRELWSAQTQLNLRTNAYQDRRIYTFDSTDTTGNRLKSFCAPEHLADGATPFDGCDDTAGLSSTELAYFEPLTGGPTSEGWTPLIQSTGWTATDGTGRTTAATKEKVLNYLRGDESSEIVNIISPTASDLFRNRTGLLGDIINAQPAYVKGSPFGYTDAFYSDFKNDTNGITAIRYGRVYSAANDGMLHAFATDPDNNPYFQTAGIATTTTTDDAFTGTLDTSAIAGEGAERWAYIPRMTFVNLMRLADSPYTHRYYTDASPVVGDICFDQTASSDCSAKSKWHTILVAGLNAGGRGYYALDLTNPDSPKGLWEFNGGGSSCIDADSDVTSSSGQTEDCNLGYSFGNPVLTKLPSSFSPAAHAGKWAVIFTSGYNNVSPGDGVGHLYIVEAQTGKLLKRLSTAVGDTTTPSGLGRINAWTDDAFTNNTSRTVYGGDLHGNLWRFQLEADATVTANSVTRLVSLTAPDGTEQSITTRPELGEVSGKRVVFVGTGRLLGTSDTSSTQKQSIYAVKDNMDSVTSPAVSFSSSGAGPRTITGFVNQTLSVSGTDATVRTVTTINSVDFTDTTVKGWFVDLPDGGSGGNGAERVNVDPILQLGTLVVASNVPSADTCVAGGFGWLNFLDYKTGAYVPGATLNTASNKISASLIVGINVVKLPGGTVKTIVTTADNQQITKETPASASTVQGKRVSWRELLFE